MLMMLSTTDYETRITDWLRRSSTKQQSVSEIPELATAIGTTVGQIRKENQDRAVAVRFTPPNTERTNPAFILFILCDGIGGLSEGDRCAELAIAATIMTLVTQDRTVPPAKKLNSAVSAANRQLHAKYRGKGGTTLVAVLMCSDGRTFSVSAGDSRVYRSRPGKMQLQQVTVDDTIAGELSRVRGTALSQDQLDSVAGHLAQYVGIGDGFEPRINPLQAMGGDEILLLTSDGAHAAVHSILAQIIAAAPDQQTLATRLLYLSRWCGGSDNATVICTTEAGKFDSHTSSPTGALELWNPFGKYEILLDPEYLRRTSVHELLDQPRRRQEPPLYPPRSGELEFRGSKRKSRRDSPNKQEQHVEVQVTKEAIRETSFGGSEEPRSAGLFPTTTPSRSDSEKAENHQHSETGADVASDRTKQSDAEKLDTPTVLSERANDGAAGQDTQDPAKPKQDEDPKGLASGNNK